MFPLAKPLDTDNAFAYFGGALAGAAGGLAAGVDPVVPAFSGAALAGGFSVMKTALEDDPNLYREFCLEAEDAKEFLAEEMTVEFFQLKPYSDSGFVGVDYQDEKYFIQLLDELNRSRDELPVYGVTLFEASEHVDLWLSADYQETGRPVDVPVFPGEPVPESYLQERLELTVTGDSHSNWPETVRVLESYV